MRILRHPLKIVDKQTVSVGGPLISVAVSRQEPHTQIDAWSVDHGLEYNVNVYIIGTGNDIPPDAQNAISNGTFLGTVVAPNGFVWHAWMGEFK